MNYITEISKTYNDFGLEEMEKWRFNKECYVNHCINRNILTLEYVEIQNITALVHYYLYHFFHF